MCVGDTIIATMHNLHLFHVLSRLDYYTCFFKILREGDFRDELQAEEQGTNLKHYYYGGI